MRNVLGAGHRVQSFRVIAGTEMQSQDERGVGVADLVQDASPMPWVSVKRQIRKAKNTTRLDGTVPRRLRSEQLLGLGQRLDLRPVTRSAAAGQ